jgi:hypothetical protein
VAVDTLHADARLVKDGPWEDALRGALEAARSMVEAEAERREVRPRDLATTLIVAVASGERIAVAQIGDGCAVVRDAAGNISALTTPPQGEYVNETKFLVSPGALETAQAADWRGEAAEMALLTDGLQMLALAMPETTPFAPFFTPMFEFVRNADDADAASAELAVFLESPRVSARTDDDVTLLLAAVGA